MRPLLLALLLVPPQDGSLTRTIPDDAGSAEAPILLGIGIHVEPFGAEPSKLAGDVPFVKNRKADYANPVFFRRQVEDIREVIKIVERHRGKLTVQAQTPFTRVAAESKETIFTDLEKNGHEVALHFHEDAHLGRESEKLDAAIWTAVLKEEIEFLKKAGATKIRYWSGGNLYGHLLEAASAAGLDVMGDYKNPKIQKSDERLLGVAPWRPSASPTDLAGFAKHDPAGKILYLPSGLFSRADYAAMRRSQDAGGDWKYFDYMTESLEASLRAAKKGQANVFHITIHPGEFRGSPRKPFDVLDQWLTKAVDPLVKSGRARWATYSEMADAAVARPKPTMTFAVNVHDWRNIDESAATILRLIEIFRKYKVRGDFYLTAPMVEGYAEKHPEVLEKLKTMTVSYHVRAPHPLWKGFDGALQGLDDEGIEKVLRDYETYRLDLATGGLDRSRPGGYAYVAKMLRTPPVVIGSATAEPRVRAIALKVYREMGAKAVIKYHESGTKMESPLEFWEGLLVRPSDFSITRWKLEGEKEDQFWWNRRDPDPLSRLKMELANWKGTRTPYVTALIHENNFPRFGPESWTFIYYKDKKKGEVNSPPFDLETPDRSRVRSRDEQEKIWAAYEAMVAYAAGQMEVATSEDLVARAKK